MIGLINTSVTVLYAAWIRVSLELINGTEKKNFLLGFCLGQSELNSFQATLL